MWDYALVREAVVIINQGKIESAMESLIRAILLAEPEDYVREFIDESKPIAQLLRQLAASGFVPGYICMLLASSSPEPGEMHSSSEPLTERELEVLSLFVAGIANREITDTFSTILI